MKSAHSRAGMYGLLADLLNRRVDVQLVRRLREAGAGSIIPDTENGLDVEISQGLRNMAQYIQAVAGNTLEEVEQELAVDWTRLFRGGSSEYSPPPPYEGLYRRDQREIKTLEEVSRLYAEFGFRAERGHSNRPDYIGIELDFLRHLSERESEAWRKGNSVEARESAEASKVFISDHMRRWYGKFCAVAINYVSTSFYWGLLFLIKGILNVEVERTGF